MLNHFGLLDTDVMPIFMIIALYIVIIWSPTVLFAILREASSETYGPRVSFQSYKFPIYNFSFLFTFFAIFYFLFHKPKNNKNITLPFIHLYQTSLANKREGIDTPLSRWVQVGVVCAGIR